MIFMNVSIYLKSVQRYLSKADGKEFDECVT